MKKMFSLLMMAGLTFSGEVISSDVVQKKDSQGITVQIIPVGVVTYTNFMQGWSSVVGGIIGGAIAGFISGALDAEINEDAAKKNTKNLTEVGAQKNLQIYLAEQVAKNLPQCNINPNVYKKVLSLDEVDPRAQSNWYKNSDAYLISNAEVDPSARYFAEIRVGQVTLTSSISGDDVKVSAYAKIYKLPRIEYVDKFSFTTTGYKYLKHYKNDDPKKNEELLTEIKNLLDLRGIEIAKEICDTTMTYYMSDSGQRVYIPKK